MHVHLSSKSRHKKAQLTEAQFGPVLNWASIAQDRKSTRLNSSHITRSRMPSSA